MPVMNLCLFFIFSISESWKRLSFERYVQYIHRLFANLQRREIFTDHAFLWNRRETIMKKLAEMFSLGQKDKKKRTKKQISISDGS